VASLGQVLLAADQHIRYRVAHANRDLTSGFFAIPHEPT
jgi:hypothetical protein